MNHLKKNLLPLISVVIISSAFFVSCSVPTVSKDNSTANLSSSVPDNIEKNSTSSLETNSEVTEIGAVAAKDDTHLNKEKMLTYAIQDEYLAQQEYQSIIDKYGANKPFTNIIEAEKNHISQLQALFKQYSLPVPANTSKDHVQLPPSLNDAYKAGVNAEIANIDMYENFLKEDLPQDIKDTFVSLRDASQKHLAAFKNNLK